MEWNLEMLPELSCPDERTEAKYVSGLSTVLVASVQEAKDRISQIEYVFCRQLYPHFLAKSKTLQKQYAEAREAAENDFREKEKDLLYQIETLRQEKQQLSDEISIIKTEKKEFDTIDLSPNEIRKLERDLKKTVELNDVLRETIERAHDEVRFRDKVLDEREESLVKVQAQYEQLMYLYKGDVEKLKSELANQTKVVDSGMYLQNKLLGMLQSYAFTAMNKGPFEDPDEKTHVLLTSVEDITKKAAELQEKLKEKTQEIERGREVQENFLKKIEQQAIEIKGYEQQSNKSDEEKRLLATKIESLQDDVNLLREEVRKKKAQVEEGRKLQEHLIQEIDSYNKEKIKARQEFEEVAKEKQELLAKLGRSKQKPDRLQTFVPERSEASSEDMVLHSKLLQQIEAKDSQIMLEKQKRKDYRQRLKSLTSQYTFLCSKYGLTPDNAIRQYSTENRSDLLRHDKSTLISAGPNARGAPCEATKVKGNELLEQGVQILLSSNSASPSSRIFVQPKSAKDVKSCPPAGTKRPASYWRDTRSHKSRIGPDIHDDFLDTPLEKVNGELDNARKDKAHQSERSAPKGLDFDDTEDETQDMNVEGKSERRQIPPSGPGTSNFKYVEPVRKKSARENLKGFECKQCKKFYDAVLPTDGKEANPNAQNLHCEHQEGVSRHRYRYAPPLTPEGFWNIGFESEM